MKRSARILMPLLIVLVMAGCNTMARQPILLDAKIVPTELKPGDSAVLSVKLEKDKFEIVDSVKAVVKQDERMKFALKDDGAPPDAAAGDKLYTLLVDVPFMAPPGEYTLDLVGYDAKGGMIAVKAPEGGEAPLSASCSFTVITKPEQAEDNK